MADDNAPSNSTPTTDGVEDAPTAEPARIDKFMTIDQVNAAITSQLRRQERRFEKQLADALAAARSEQPKPADPDQAAALEAMLAIESERAAQLTAATEREQALLARELRSEVEHQLSELGAVNVRAARLVLAEDSRIGRTEDGKLCFYDDGGAPVDLASGIRQWLASAEGKHFMPPRGGGEGSGHVQRSGAPRIVSNQPTKTEQRREAVHVLSQFVLGERR